jgi:membrane protease YdiL (CAAX protease family)
MGKNNDRHLLPRKPVWNIWQGLFLVAVVTLIEWPLGWLKTPAHLDSASGILNFITIGLGDALLYFTAFGIFLRSMRLTFHDLGFTKPRKQHLALGLAFGFLLYLAVGYLGNYLTRFLGTPAPQSFATAVTNVNTLWEFGLLLFLGGIVAPLKEEMFFRGFMYPPLRHSFGKGKGLLLTGLLFAVLHLDVVRFLPLFLGGIVLTWLYERTESIWPSIIAHGTWNILMALALWTLR